MNAPLQLQHLSLAQSVPAQAPEDENDINFIDYWNIVLDNRWLVAAIVAASVAIGSAYALLGKPLYESNLLIQVEDSTTSAKSFLGEAASLFDVKTPASAEIEILRSRMVIGQAVDKTLYFIEAQPRYIPLIGATLARQSQTVSQPGIFGLGGWVSGAETITVSAFDVPAAFEGTKFRLTLRDGNRYALSHPDLDKDIVGKLGTVLTAALPEGPLHLVVSDIQAKPGAQFDLYRHSRTETIETLQEKIKLTEKGRQSGVIDATLQNTDRMRLALILNEIGRQYVQQNIERKAAEAEKTIAFLNVQLPQFKKQLDVSEDAYNKYRNQKGTIALDEEAKVALARGVDLQTKLVEAQQKKVELISRFTPVHPAIKTLDVQITSWQKEISDLNRQIKQLPSIQQDAIRLERDVKVNNDLYQQLRNTALQLQLVREGKIGNVRLIDPANLPEEPVQPKKTLAIGLALVFGLFAGITVSILRNSIFQGIRSAQEIESATGLNVYSTIPLSATQKLLAAQVHAKELGLHILAHSAPADLAIESLRSLRTALQFAMLEANNNTILITGATPNVGKSFVSANFAAVLAGAGKRVLLIDADLRKGYLNQYFGVDRARGLSETISGSLRPEEVIHRGLLPNLDVITTGVLPPNPAELMGSAAFGNILENLAAAYDLVIIDSAPVLVAADTLSAAAHAGTVLLVARADHSQVGELVESAKRLVHAGKVATGVLFNGFDVSRRHYGRYGYRYGNYRYQTYEYKA
jgi:tyrosine-protein kinase Etk/Wzc